MLRSDDITTPLPSDIEDDQTQQDPSIAPAIPYPDAQVRIAVITQEVHTLLYMKRRSPRSWAQTHAIITSMISELDDWALEAMPQQQLEGAQMLPNYDVQQTMLRKQYCRVKILITRPSLRRVELCHETGTDDATPFDQEIAETCIRTAQDVASLLPEKIDLKLVYEKGPWWTIMHNSELFSPTFPTPYLLTRDSSNAIPRHPPNSHIPPPLLPLLLHILRHIRQETRHVAAVHAREQRHGKARVPDHTQHRGG